jgi:hypothetical protein
VLHALPICKRHLKIFHGHSLSLLRHIIMLLSYCSGLYKLYIWLTYFKGPMFKKSKHESLLCPINEAPVIIGRWFQNPTSFNVLKREFRYYQRSIKIQHRDWYKWNGHNFESLFYHGPPLWSSSQSSWLQSQRSVFDSRRYKIFWDAVGLERGPLSLVSTIEELPERNSSASGLENQEYGRRDQSC